MNKIPTIRPKMFIYPRGNLGNQMLQLIFAMSLAARVPVLDIIGYDMPIWGLSAPGQLRLGLLAPSLRLRETDGYGCESLISGGKLLCSKLRDVPLRCDLFESHDYFSDIFPLQEGVNSISGPEDLLISVRGGETLLSTHPDYGPIAVDWYRHLIGSTGLRPVFFGQLGDDYYSNLLRRTFPTARFEPSRGILTDFTLLRLANHLALSVSTFSWLAGWLSRARTVHMPLLGIFNPQQRPDIWLVPTQDRRYRYYEFPVRQWQATPEQIVNLEGRWVVEQVDAVNMVALYRRIMDERKAARERALKRLSRASILSSLAARSSQVGMM